MMEWTKTYNAGAFQAGVKAPILHKEIVDAGLDTVDGGAGKFDGLSVDAWGTPALSVKVMFSSEPTSSEEATLDQVIANHHAGDASPNERAMVHRYALVRSFYKALDYKTQLDRRLERDETWFKGTLLSVVFYAEYDEASGAFSVPVVEEVDAYDTNALDIYTKRTRTITWYDTSGKRMTEAGAQKILTKHYLGDSGLAATKRRRANVIAYVKDGTLRYMLATIAQPEAEIIALAQGFLNIHTPAMTLWIESGLSNLGDDVAAATDFWLDNVCNDPEQGNTIREFILYNIDYVAPA